MPPRTLRLAPSSILIGAEGGKRTHTYASIPESRNQQEDPAHRIKSGWAKSPQSLILIILTHYTPSIGGEMKFYFACLALIHSVEGK